MFQHSRSDRGLGARHLPPLGIEELLDKVDLHEPAGEDDEALHDRPRGHVAPVWLEHVEVARLEAAGELLELPHRLDALVDVHEGVSEGLGGNSIGLKNRHKKRPKKLPKNEKYTCITASRAILAALIKGLLKNGP